MPFFLALCQVLLISQCAAISFDVRSEETLSALPTYSKSVSNEWKRRYIVCLYTVCVCVCRLV